MTAKKKPEKDPKPFFTADLELTGINRNDVEYQVINPNGAKVLNLHHLTMSRIVVKDGKPVKSVFPVDDNFSLDFINKDLEDAEPYTENEAETMSEGDKRNAEKAFAGMVRKQAEFRKFQRLQLAIFKDR